MVQRLGGLMEIKDEERMAMIPLIAHELAMARLERIIKRMVAIIILLVGIIAFGVYEWTQFDYADITVDSRDLGNANYLGAGTSGVINNAANSRQKEN